MIEVYYLIDPMKGTLQTVTTQIETTKCMLIQLFNDTRIYLNDKTIKVRFPPTAQQ